ncbi:MAG: hypothetical protein ACI85N_000052 [Gammaproteobacteria bacterium]|jgi:hypothetical protein
MKRIILALLLLNLAMPIYAADSYLDGDQLLSKCKEAIKGADGDANYNSSDTNLCFGYLQSAADTHHAYTKSGLIEPIFCRPEGTSVGNLVLIVVKFLETHPDVLHNAAGGLVSAALREAFPCSATLEPPMVPKAQDQPDTTYF